MVLRVVAAFSMAIAVLVLSRVGRLLPIESHAFLYYSKYIIINPTRPPIHTTRFATYNYLNATLPQYDELPKKLARSAVIGFAASAISDTCSNSIRVVKTVRG